MNAVRGTEIPQTIAGRTGIGHRDIREPRTRDIAGLSVEPRYACDLAVDILIGHVGVVGIMLVPALVGELHEAAVAEALFDRALEMVGLEGKGRAANALGRVRIPPDAERDIVAEERNGRRII